MTALAFVIALTALRELPNANTAVRAAAFTATLPGVWQQQASQPDLVYTRGDDQLYISIVNLANAQEKEDRERTAFRIADMRRKLAGDLSQGRANVSRVNKEGDGMRTMLWFRGDDPQNGKRLYVAVIALPDAIVTTALYRPLSAPPAGFDELARTIAGSVKDAR